MWKDCGSRCREPEFLGWRPFAQAVLLWPFGLALSRLGRSGFSIFRFYKNIFVLEAKSAPQKLHVGGNMIGENNLGQVCLQTFAHYGWT